MRSLALAAALAVSSAPLTGCQAMGGAGGLGGLGGLGSGTIQQILTGVLGSGLTNAIAVGSAREENHYVSQLGFQDTDHTIVRQDDKAYDVVTVVDPLTGEQRKLYFDVTSFNGRGLQ